MANPEKLVWEAQVRASGVSEGLDPLQYGEQLPERALVRVSEPHKKLKKLSGLEAARKANSLS